MSREKAQNLIINNGGKIAATVSRKTSYLLAGENPGSKLEKAVKLEIPIIDETQTFGNVAISGRNFV